MFVNFKGVPTSSESKRENENESEITWKDCVDSNQGTHTKKRKQKWFSLQWVQKRSKKRRRFRFYFHCSWGGYTRRVR